MKIQLIVAKMQLFFSLFIITLFAAFLISPISLADELSAQCPLPESIAVTFLNSQCTEFTLTQDTKFYRYYDSNSKYQKGRYLTIDNYDSSEEVITKLALNQAWGNDAKYEETVSVPAGTKVYIGIAAPQEPSTCYPGGGHQVFIQDSKDTRIIWSNVSNEEEPYTYTKFNCNL